MKKSEITLELEDEPREEVKQPEGTERRVQTRRNKKALRKYKKLIGTYLKTAEFKQPTAILLRRTGKAEFLEGCIEGNIEITHTDGTKRPIYLTGQHFSMDYGEQKFKTYILHEDSPLPLPNLPVLSSEKMQDIEERILMDMEKWKSRKTTSRNNITDIIKWVAIAIGGLVLTFALAKMLVPDFNLLSMLSRETVETTVTAVAPVVQETAQQTVASVS